MSSVVKLKPATLTPAETALAELHASRRELDAGMADLTAKIARAQAEPLDVVRARAELAALDARERAAAVEWADAGAMGEPPVADVHARAALNKRMAGAEASSAASAAAAAVLSHRRSELTRKRNALLAQISAAAVAVMIDRLEVETAEARSLIEKLTPLMASLDGRRNAVVAEIHREGPNGASQHHHEHMWRLERIPGTHDLLRGNPQPFTAHQFAAELEALKNGEQK